MNALEELACRLDPSLILELAGLDPDEWQRQVLRSNSDRILMLCARQSGKSTAAAGLALHSAMFSPGSLSLLLSPSLRQSGELFRKILELDLALGRPMPAVQESATTLIIANGSRIVSLPGSPETIRGFSAADLVIIDEAALTSDELLTSVLPMLAVSRGKLVGLSTPRGQRGWFAAAWSDGGDSWERHTFTAPQNPRIDKAWLEEQRTILGDRWFNQEFLCHFVDTVDQVFSSESVLQAFDSEAAPLFSD